MHTNGFATALLIFGISTPAIAATLPSDVPDLDLRTSGHVDQLEAQADGKLIVAGFFSRVDDVTTHLARMNPDGSVDGSWTTEFAGPVETLTVSTNGNVYVGTFGGTILKIPLLGAGAADPGFWFSDNFEESAVSLVVNGAYLYVATESHQVRRYDATTGDRDVAWASAAEGGRLIPDQAGHLYVDATRINVVDGSLDSAWSAPSIPDGVTATALGSDGNLYVASYGAIGHGGIEGLARLRTDAHGTVDASWHPVGKGDAATSVLNALLTRADGSVVIAGEFDRIGGVACRNLAHLVGPNAIVDPAWTADPDGGISALVAGPAQSIVAAGHFTTIDASAHASIVRLSVDGTVDAAFTGGIFGDATVSVVTPDHQHRRTYVGGRFDWVGGAPHRNLLRLGANGTLDADWRPSVDEPDEVSSYSTSVTAIAVGQDDVTIGGRFSHVNGVALRSLARVGATAPGLVDSAWNPALVGTFADPSSVDSRVNALATDSAGRLIVAGDFSAIGGVSQSMLARIDLDGDVDTGWRPDPYFPVLRMASAGDSSLYFIVEDSTPHSFPAKVSLETGQFDSAWDTAARLQTAYDIALGPDGSIFVAGSNGDPGGTRVVRISPSTGVVDSSWSPPSNCQPSRIAVDHQGTVYAAGTTLQEGTLAGCMQRIDTDGRIDAGFSPTWLANSILSAVAVDENGIVVVGGLFDSVSGRARRALAAFENADSILHDGFDP